MILIDTSCWIEALRINGDPKIQSRVREFIIQDKAAWCPMIQLELWNGVSKPKEKQYLQELSCIHLLEITQGVWNLAFELVQKCRQNGTPIPNTDALIAACAKFHKVALLHNDKHFEFLQSISE